jgi:hypothetical protein
VAGCAIVSDQTHLPHAATVATVGSAAVDVGFKAVFFTVNALAHIALKRSGVACLARAVGIELATLPDAALITSPAAAVGVGFGAVFFIVSALISIAPGGYTVAGVGRAIVVDLAHQPRGATRTAVDSAAVHVGFGAILSLVHAQTRHALGRYKVADVARASGIAGTGPSDRLAHAGAVAASLPADADMGAPAAVVGIVVCVDLATIRLSIVITIREAGIAGDVAISSLAARRSIVG